MNIGKRIKYFRNLKGFSARALAFKIELDPSQISKIETGVSKPSLDTLSNICSALDITLADFFAEEKKDMPSDLMHLLEEAKNLSPEQREQLTNFLKTLKQNDPPKEEKNAADITYETQTAHRVAEPTEKWPDNTQKKPGRF